MSPANYSPVPQEAGRAENGTAKDSYPPIRPATYYGEGEFDPPSSDDEEDAFLEKGKPEEAELNGDGMVDDGELVVGGKKRRPPNSLRWLVICLSALVTVAAVIGIFAALSYKGTAYRIHGSKHITMDHIFNGTFTAHSSFVRWIPEAGDGVFATNQGDDITLIDLKTNTTKKLVTKGDVKDPQGKQLSWDSWDLSSDMRYMLIKSDNKKQWRHSSFGNYYIHDLSTYRTQPLTPPANPPVTSYAKWSPTGESIAFVAHNDLFVLPSPSSSSAIQVTTSGNASLFHGVPDWVYEEEIFSADYALWWSPDSAKIAYLSFDETTVDEYTFPIYNPTEDSHTVHPYPEHVTMKYPKPGYDNPLVSVHVFEVDRFNALKTVGGTDAVAVQQASWELTWDNRLPADNRVVVEVVWVANSTLLVEEVDRAAVNGSVVLFDLASGAVGRGQTVRKLGQQGEEGDDGWIEPMHAIRPLPPTLTTRNETGYVDLVPTKDGFNHVALFSPASSSEPRFLTKGDWEVTEILGIDPVKRLVYFQAANPSSLERHIYSTPIPALDASPEDSFVEPTALTDRTSPGFYTASFSPQAGFYLLTYQGPTAPWQKIIDADDAKFDYTLTENSALNATLAEFELPVVTYGTIENEGYELNYREIRPFHMDDSGKTKYPVLFYVYGGPNSQQVSYRYGLDWHQYLASVHQYIIVTVDGRGTGFKGRKLRTPVKDKLGKYETIDQIAAAKQWAAKDYVDPGRIGIWGWSYGGFMSCKVAEADAGVHSLAMAVAPVTSWRLYDSIYTERYLSLPSANPSGYETASITNVTGFRNLDFSLAHGSADDNVHFANTMRLADMLTQEQVRGWRMRVFTDSDHSIYKRGANREVYEFMHSFLVEKWGKGPRQRGW